MNKKQENISIHSDGNQIIISGRDGLSLEQAHRLLAAKYQEEEGDVRVSEPVKCFPLDGATALYDVVSETFGWTSLEPTPSFFGAIPPELFGVEIGYNKTRQIPWGRMSLPGVTGFVEAGVTRTTLGMLEFHIGGVVKRKDRGVIAEIADKVRERVKKSSIYKGKIVSLNFRTTDGDRFEYDDFDFQFSPEFLEIDESEMANLVYSDEIEKVIQTNLINPIKYTERCRKFGVPLKRGILLAGSYGTGKTLTAYRVALECAKNGWTFLYLKDVRDLDMALHFAKLYEPCVIFSEDVDRSMAGNRTPQMDQILNTLDGVDSKTMEVMVLLTTNFIEQINAAFIRPGRMDTIVELAAPDQKTTVQVIRNYSGQIGLTLIGTDDEIYNSLSKIHGANTAFIREAVERAKLSAIQGATEDGLRITPSDLETAASSLEMHVKMLQAETEGSEQEGPDCMESVATILAHEILEKLSDPEGFKKALSRYKKKI